MSVLEFLRDRPIDVSIFGFSHLLQVTSDLGSNPGGSSWHLDFDVRGVHFNASVWFHYYLNSEMSLALSRCLDASHSHDTDQ